MTPEERFERIEQTLAEMAESQQDFQKRHEESLASHASWLNDHERWMRDQELIEEGHQRWKMEMELTLVALAAGQKALQAEQAVTAFKLQAFIDSLRQGGNGHRKE